MAHKTPAAARSIMASRQEPDDSRDMFPTPPWATRALIEVVMPQIGVTHHQMRDGVILEPACGEGHMAEVLREYSRGVIASDIHDYGYGDGVQDFTTWNPSCEWDRPHWIITNPPYNGREEIFALRAIDIATVGVALFVRQQWLETVGRYGRIFKPHPPSIIAQFSERVPLARGRWNPDGSTATAYLWIIWLRERLRGPVQFFWIPPGQRDRLTLPDDSRRFTAHPVIRQRYDRLWPQLMPSPDASSSVSSPDASVTTAVEHRAIEAPADLSLQAE